MTLRITIIYFNGAGRDILQFHGLTTEEAGTHRERFLGEIQGCLENGQMFRITGDNGSGSQALAFGPGLLRDAHIKFEVVDGDIP